VRGVTHPIRWGLLDNRLLPVTGGHPQPSEPGTFQRGLQNLRPGVDYAGGGTTYHHHQRASPSLFNVVLGGMSVPNRDGRPICGLSITYKTRYCTSCKAHFDFCSRPVCVYDFDSLNTRIAYVRSISRSSPLCSSFFLWLSVSGYFSSESPFSSICGVVRSR
jgi:hypothetical protein